MSKFCKIIPTTIHTLTCLKKIRHNLQVLQPILNLVNLEFIVLTLGTILVSSCAQVKKAYTAPRARATLVMINSSLNLRCLLLSFIFCYLCRV